MDDSESFRSRGGASMLTSRVTGRHRLPEARKLSSRGRSDRPVQSA
jgi:hypothetical protein